MSETQTLEQKLANLHPLERATLELCWAIEKFPASKQQTDLIIQASALRSQIAEHLKTPLNILLPCPECGSHHVDAPEPENDWTNPPHKSHLCHACGTVWRPADVPTNGVARIQTRGDADTWSPPEPVRCETCGDKGEVMREYGSPVDIEPTQVTEPCPDCDPNAAA